MRKQFLLTTALIAGSLVFSSGAFAKTAKAEYCNNQEYYTDTGANAGGTYPHLHCGKNWITYSKGKSTNQHYNFYDGNGVNKGTANSACSQADSQGSPNLKAKINTICNDYNVTCNECN